MPPITICNLRQRPAGLEFLACYECHEGTRLDDQVAGVVCRAFPDPETEAQLSELRSLIRGLANNQPDVFREWAPSEEQLSFAHNAGGVFESSGALNIGPKTHSAMLRFSARAAAALHFETTQRIVPAQGAIWVTWHTNERLVKGDFPSQFADFLPPGTTLGHETKRSLEGQFDYSSAEMNDSIATAHMITFRLSFAIQAAVTENAEVFRALEQAKPECVLRPGFLKLNRRRKQ